MEIKPLTPQSPLWKTVAEYAGQCSWKAGKKLAKAMKAGCFRDWERVFAVFDSNCIAGYCAFVKDDCIPDVPYTPYISYMFVGEEHRGHRYSQRLIENALEYAAVLGYEKVYLVSDHVNLYEKYGFVKVDEKPAPWNPSETETIFMYSLVEKK